MLISQRSGGSELGHQTTNSYPTGNRIALQPPSASSSFERPKKPSGRSTTTGTENPSPYEEAECIRRFSELEEVGDCNQDASFNPRLKRRKPEEFGDNVRVKESENGTLCQVTRTSPLKIEQSPRHAFQMSEKFNDLPRPTESLFADKPSWFPRSNPHIVLDHWHHGQLVWWNRFLANRKKTKGLSTGYHVGTFRIVVIEYS